MPVTSPSGTQTANTQRFPQTRYQGSKRKLADAIVDHLSGIEFDTVLDAFGGTGAVAYALKCAGKQVTYNDLLAFNHQIGLALIQNDKVKLSDSEIESITERHSSLKRGDFIEQTFEGIYFTTEENRWLDQAIANIHNLPCPYKRALAWFALFQSAMIKRPYNLFHRANLYMRTAKVERSFGNKSSWDRSFAEHFKNMAAEANKAIIDSGGKCRATCGDAMQVSRDFDLVYIDTPYINHRGVGVDYRSFYHFLEGMVFYDDWPELIDYRSKHRRLSSAPDPWSDSRRCLEMFSQLFEHFHNSVLVVSYRNNGFPTIEELRSLLLKYKSNVKVIEGPAYQYALSTNRKTRETLLIAR